MRKPQVILAVDRPAWAFHHIADKLCRYLSDEFLFRVVPFGLLISAKCDIAVSMWWNALPFVKQHTSAKKHVLCLYDHVSWKSAVDAKAFTEALQQACSLIVGNERLLNDLRYRNLLNQPTYLCEDGVDTEIFKPTPLPKKLTAGWCGDSMVGHGLIKGLPMIKEACEKTGVDLLIADRSNKTNVPFLSMPEWYSNISFYICASMSEGTPNPPLEALACGRPVITTNVGIMPRVIQQGASGYIVNRTVEDIAEAIEKIKKQDLNTMGMAARDAALCYDWTHKIPAWRAALREAAREL